MKPRPSVLNKTINLNLFIKKAEIIYQGKPFTFYNCLVNFGRQYSIYLIPLTQTRHDRSLHPNVVNRHIFSKYKYTTMATTLCKKFTRTDMIPETYHQPCLIIECSENKIDSYQALYKILEDSHATLKKDPKQRAPKYSDCKDNINEYSAQCISQWSYKLLCSRNTT